MLSVNYAGKNAYSAADLKGDASRAGPLWRDRVREKTFILVRPVTWLNWGYSLADSKSNFCVFIPPYYISTN